MTSNPILSSLTTWAVVVAKWLLLHPVTVRHWQEALREKRISCLCAGYFPGTQARPVSGNKSCQQKIRQQKLPLVPTLRSTPPPPRRVLLPVSNWCNAGNRCTHCCWQVELLPLGSGGQHWAVEYHLIFIAIAEFWCQWSKSTDLTQLYILLRKEKT